jgi:hypothetical protein
VAEAVPLDRAQDLQKMLGDAGIPLGSTDYTDFEKTPLVRGALTAHAAAHLADLAQERGAAYADKGYTFAPVALAEIRVGTLPGVAYGFTGYDGDGRVIERRLTYTALDNKALYTFGALYADGAPDGFVGDKELVRFEPYLRQILARLRLPASGDWRSPGAELIHGPLLVVQRPDDSIQYLALDGLSAVLVAEAPGSLLPAGYGGVPFGGGAPMMDGPIVYVRQLWGGLYSLDRILGQVFPLEFVPPNAPVAVRPLTEGLLPEGAPISLAWGELSASDPTTARLYLSAPDGSQAVEALRESYGASDQPFQFVPWRWREDGQLYYSRQPVEGMGGFPPFVNAASLWLYDPKSGGSAELVSHKVTGGKLCLAAIAADNRRVVHHCDERGMAILDLETGIAAPVSLPSELAGELQLGSVRFSPDGSRIAFAAMTGGYQQIEGTQGYVVVSDNLDLSRSAHVIATSDPGEWFSISGWLSDDLLVLQSHGAGPGGWPAVWTVRADGSGLVKLAEGVFLAGLGG